MAQVMARVRLALMLAHDSLAANAFDERFCCGAGDENRTRMVSLEGRGQGA
jgi:hypothetical protein